MTTRNHSFLASFAVSNTVALLLSVVVTFVWLGAVVASFDAVGKPAPRRVDLASVTVVYRVAAKVAQLTTISGVAAHAASADGKL